MFIDDYFYEKDVQDGIFTLSKENKEIEIKIKDIERDIEDLKKEREIANSTISQKLLEKNKLSTNIKDNIFNKYSTLRNGELRPLLKHRKENFFDEVYNNLFDESEERKSLDKLESEYSDLIKNKGVSKDKLSELIKYTLSEDDYLLLNEPLVPLGDNYLSTLIKTYNNYDWVKHGLDNYIKTESCPFCQSKTITGDFIEALSGIFDKTYEKTISDIRKLRDVYSNYYDYININVIEINNLISDDKKELFEALHRELSNLIIENIKKIDEKISSPSKKIQLSELIILNELNEIINYENDKIEILNHMVKNFRQSENKIRSILWNEIRYECADLISVYNQQASEILEEKKKLEVTENELSSKIDEKKNELKLLRESTSTIHDTIENINKNLKLLGLQGFEIDKYEQSNYYVIKRNRGNNNEKIFNTLSEGEKTLISFLYFIELCKGRRESEISSNNDLLIVIDDPISSLSQNYIYDIASIINYQLIKENTSGKIIILTHNLYFFHELIKLAPKNEKSFNNKYKLYRVYKNENSQIEPIGRYDIKNEYHSLWSIIKDAKNNKAPITILPNVMRNILEYYFSFVHKYDNLNEKIEELVIKTDNQNYRAFYRYINRGSHLDSVNISNFINIDTSNYLTLFKGIFSEMGDENHYNNMMED
ncbi:AAA family ATPase [Providencia alcalifaciens]|uniref:AAA family ATPase n=1 Tax=Providencia alcalifaciens TaxID=126385 RepID=UPI0032DA425B